MARALTPCRFLLVLVGTIPLAAGCDDHRKATPAEYDQVASSLASGLVQDTRVMVDSAAIARAAVPGHLLVDARGGFAGVVGGMNVVVDVTCRDAAGAVQPQCTPQTPAADVSARWALGGGIPGAGASISADASWKLGGLDTDRVHAQGRASFDLSVQASLAPVAGAAGPIDLKIRTEHDLIIPRAGAGSASGFVRASVEGRNPSNSDWFRVTAEIQLDGQGGAVVILDGSRRYRVDLAGGGVVVSGP